MKKVRAAIVGYGNYVNICTCFVSRCIVGLHAE